MTLLRPPIWPPQSAAPPPRIPAHAGGGGLEPGADREQRRPDATSIDADDYFGTLGNDGWLKALTFNTLLRTWSSVEPGETENLDGDATVSDTDDTLTPETPVQVTVGKGYWLYATRQA